MWVGGSYQLNKGNEEDDGRDNAHEEHGHRGDFFIRQECNTIVRVA